ncbi:ParB/RepB/Spo0J family partition protein [bacterium 210917-DFI.7.65]|nr:ParB/RepB/Spo0J family partition protein [bacterium 210917-DFI.7.65]
MARTMQKGLGKGLGALLGDTSPLSSASAAEGSGVTMLPIAKVEAYRKQPRKQFDEASLQDLADSIRRHGILQPLTVRKLSSGYYQIIAGERRWRAARMAGLSEVPVLIIEADDRKAMELAMIENLQREDLNPIEEAEGYKALMEDYGLTQEEAAERVGKSRSNVANVLRLLNLSAPVRALLAKGVLSAGHARALLPLKAAAQEKAAKAVAEGGLSVRQTEALAKKLLSETDKSPSPKAAKAGVDYTAEAEKELSSRLSRGCRIVTGRKKGKIELEYYDLDDLNDLIDALRVLEIHKHRT